MIVNIRQIRHKRLVDKRFLEVLYTLNVIAVQIVGKTSSVVDLGVIFMQFQGFCLVFYCEFELLYIYVYLSSLHQKLVILG